MPRCHHGFALPTLRRRKPFQGCGSRATRAHAWGPAAAPAPEPASTWTSSTSPRRRAITAIAWRSTARGCTERRTGRACRGSGESSARSTRWTACGATPCRGYGNALSLQGSVYDAAGASGRHDPCEVRLPAGRASGGRRRPGIAVLTLLPWLRRVEVVDELREIVGFRALRSRPRQPRRQRDVACPGRHAMLSMRKRLVVGSVLVVGQLSACARAARSRCERPAAAARCARPSSPASPDGALADRVLVFARHRGPLDFDAMRCPSLCRGMCRAGDATTESCVVAVSLRPHAGGTDELPGGLGWRPRRRPRARRRSPRDSRRGAAARALRRWRPSGPLGRSRRRSSPSRPRRAT